MTRDIRRRPDAGYRRSAQPAYRAGTVGASASFHVADPASVLAANARTLKARLPQPCPGCGQAMGFGDRVADLAGAGGTAHLTCIGDRR